MHKVVEYCDECEHFWETTEEMASLIRERRSDPDTCHEPVLCDDCTLSQMAETAKSCYKCGDALSLEDDGLCYHCAYDEYELEQDFSYQDIDEIFP